MTQLQQLFYNNLFCNNKNLDFISSDHSAARFAIYENTVFSGLVRSLKFTYPGIWKLLGIECARAMARRFLHQTSQLPTTGCLDDWGVAFPRFLRKQSELKSIKYLEDYAKFEWFCFRAKLAAIEQAMASNIFLSYTEDELMNLRLVFNSSIVLLKSEYDLKEINKFILANHDTDNQQLILSHKRSYMLIINDKFNAKILWPKADLWQFIWYLHQQYTLGKAVELMEQIVDNFDLIAGLNFIFSNNMVVGVDL